MTIDVYCDAYEHVKAKKRLSCRLRLTGDMRGKWFDVVEIENAHDLSRDVGNYELISLYIV